MTPAAPMALPPGNLTQPLPAAAATVAPELRTQPPQFFDYSANLNSDAFGANLFTGAFAREGATQFNPDYLVAVGDKIQVRLWGAFEFDAPLTVDPKGNIFLPHVGPIPVMGVRNQDLQRLVEAGIRRVYRANVYSYASIAAAQPVRVFVSGFVNRPGLYSGTSMDSLLHYLDQAGGIDPERGSFLNVQVKRGSQTRATLSLYDFLLAGQIPLIQLSDGDVIFVAARQNTAKVSGLAENAKRFEFSSQSSITVSELIRLAKPSALATHVRVVRNTGTVKQHGVFPALRRRRRVALQNGDAIEFTADKRPGTIAVRVEGEHMSVQEYVCPTVPDSANSSGRSNSPRSPMR
jgi:protein involved in polysaccharide export with SLBB domain